MKKKLLAVSIGMLCLHIAQAQISKGSLFLGGSLNFGSQGNKSTPINPATGAAQESKHNSWTIRPQIGKAIHENKILGLFFTIGGQRNENISGTMSQTQKTNLYGGGIFYRQYFPLSKRFFLHGESSLGISAFKQTSRYTDATINRLQSDNKGTQIGLAIAPGISFAASRKLFLEASFNNLLAATFETGQGTTYNSQGNPSSTHEFNNFSAAANANGFSNLSIGLRWILPTGK